MAFAKALTRATSYVPAQQALGPAPAIHFFPRSGPRKIRTSVSGGIRESGNRRNFAIRAPRWKDIFASRHGRGKAVNLYKKHAQSGVYTNALVFALGLFQYNFVKPS